MKVRIKRGLRLSFCDILFSSMIGIALNLPSGVIHYLNVTPLPLMLSQALLLVGWIPIFGVIVWGLTHIWMDHKQGQYAKTLKWQLLDVTVPQDSIQTPKGLENLFMNLSGVKSGITWREIWLIGKEQASFSFEIVSNEGKIQFLIRTIDKYRDLVEAAIYAQYPEAQISEIPDYVDVLPKEYPNESYDVFGSEMILSNKPYFPLRTYEAFEHQGEKDLRFKDPLLPIIEMMGKMGKQEHFWIQLVIRPPENQDWVKEGVKYLNAMMGKEEKHKPSMMSQLGEGALWLPKGIVTQLTGLGGAADAHAEKKLDDFRMFRMTPHERLMSDAVSEKISKVGWKVKIRWIYAGPKGKGFRKGLMASATKGMFATFTHQYLNGLSLSTVTPKDDYIWQAWQMPTKQRRLVSRYKRRSGGEGANWQMLNVTELATLYHFPAADARTPVLGQAGARRAEAPDALQFAKAGEESLPNWKRSSEDAKEDARVHQLPEAPLAVPTPVAPTGHDTFDSHDDAPPNLPV